MRAPIRWLRSHCDPELDTAALVDRLDMTGTEIERVERTGVRSPEGFVIGKVLSADQHPDADRLKVCSVDVGAGEPSTIVCGAPNVGAGQTVAVALPGAVMPDGTELGRARLRGVESSGMILAEDEIGIGTAHDGIMVLDDSLAAGTPAAEALTVGDEVLEAEITPNRPDCLSIYGIAREVHAATGAPLADDPTLADAIATGSTPVEQLASVEVADPDGCLRFTARAFEDVTVGPSPLWLKQRLLAAGQRPISNIVDITNYVMLETGQPLHAFDLDEVRGERIIVRRALPGERITTLDDVARELAPEMMVVADGEGPSGIAGIMGGQISEVSERTTRVLMEAATWVPPNILKTSKSLQLRSEASTRFEKGIHPDATLAAQRLAARLMVELCGATLAPGTIDVYPTELEPRTVGLRVARVERLLGERIEREEIVRTLELLGFECAGDEPLTVAIPYWRDGDVQREADLIEEIARIHGLDRLPITLPARERAVGRLTDAQRLRRRLEDALRDRGLDEIVGWSFTAPQTLQRLRLADEPALALANPLSEEQSVMRPLLLPALLDAAAHNAAHGAAGVSLFESAHVYLPSGDLTAPAGSPGRALPATEGHHFAGLLTEAAPATWRSERLAADFFAAKGLVEVVGQIAGLELGFAASPRPYLHPGRAATVSAGEHEVGWVGELHPEVAAAWDLDGAVAFELDAAALADLACGVAAFQDLTSFPSIRQDIAVVAAVDTSAARLVESVTEAGGELLVDVRVIDVYVGEQAGEGNRSVTLALRFRAPDRTLTDADIEPLRRDIEAALAQIGGRLRA